MIKTNHLLKVAAIWISIVYTVCYAGVAFYPASRELFMRYALHSDIAYKSDYFGFGYFISGLIIWNVVVVLGVWLFATLFNNIKR